MSAKQLLTTLIMVLALAATASPGRAADMPEQVTLDTMAALFEAVEFDHAMHAELGEDCSVCHHHTTGTGTADEACIRCHADSNAVAKVACRDCHVVDPFSAEHINREAQDRYQFHIDQPGLKAAYHWSCISCHEKMDGPTDCQDCHSRTPEGDDFYHAEASRSGTPKSGEH